MDEAKLIEVSAGKREAYIITCPNPECGLRFELNAVWEDDSVELIHLLPQVRSCYCPYCGGKMDE